MAQTGMESALDTLLNTVLPGPLQALAWAIALLVLAAATPGLYRHLRQADTQRWQVLLVTVVVLAMMRGFNTAALQGVLLHFLGATIATLMFGAGPALWVMAAASLAGGLMGAAWHGWAADFLLAGAVPVAVTLLVCRLVAYFLPHNIFVFVMGNAFFGAALAMAASMLGKAAMTALLGGQAAAYVAATPLLMFAEAFFAGTLIVVIVVYRPAWCVSFDDRVWLWPQQPM